MTRVVALCLLILTLGFTVWMNTARAETWRATGDLGVVIERASGSLLIIDQSERAKIGRVDGLGDLSHASVVFSPDQRYAFVFARDGGLSKVDLLTQSLVERVLQSGNAIGGALRAGPSTRLTSAAGHSAAVSVSPPT